MAAALRGSMLLVLLSCASAENVDIRSCEETTAKREEAKTEGFAENESGNSNAKTIRRRNLESLGDIAALEGPCSMEINHYKYKSNEEYAEKCKAYLNGYMQNKCSADSERKRKIEADVADRQTRILLYASKVTASMELEMAAGEIDDVTVDGAKVLVGKTVARNHDFSVVAIFRGEDDYLDEWLHYNIIQGVDHFYLYSNENDDNTERKLRPYVASGYVTLVDWPNAMLDKLAPDQQRHAWNDYTHDSEQNLAFLHFARNFKDHSKWVMKVDIDEFAFPLGKCTTLKQVLDGGDRDAELYLIPRYDMGSSGHATRFAGLVIESYTKSAPKSVSQLLPGDFKSIALASQISPSDGPGAASPHHFAMVSEGMRTMDERGMITVKLAA